MDHFERVELRRFVGREFLLFLWFESEVFEATLSTKAHGSFGLWLEGRLVLSAGQEVTAIKGSSPGNHREAKEALLRGKLPERAAVHLSWRGSDAAFTIHGETMAIGGLKLPKPGGDEAPESVPSEAPRRGRKPRRKGGDADPEKARTLAAEAEAVLAHDDLAERLRVTREIEEIVEALYEDFLALRLGPAWSALVVPALEAWAAGEEVDGDAYGKSRAKALAREPRVRARAS